MKRLPKWTGWVKELAEKTSKVIHQDTLKHVVLAILDPETRENTLEHLAEDSYE